MPPTYDYLCPDCEHTFEEFQSMSSPLLRKCPKCGRRRLRRLFGTGAGIIFKGSGFYETDYKKKTGGDSKKEGGEKADSKSESKTESKSDSKSDSKSESKPESKSESRSESKPDSGSSPKKPSKGKRD